MMKIQWRTGGSTEPEQKSIKVSDIFSLDFYMTKNQIHLSETEHHLEPENRQNIQRIPEPGPFSRGGPGADRTGSERTEPQLLSRACPITDHQTGSGSGSVPLCFRGTTFSQTWIRTRTSHQLWEEELRQEVCGSLTGSVLVLQVEKPKLEAWLQQITDRPQNCQNRACKRTLTDEFPVFCSFLFWFLFVNFCKSLDST